MNRRQFVSAGGCSLAGLLPGCVGSSIGIGPDDSDDASGAVPATGGSDPGAGPDGAGSDPDADPDELPHDSFDAPRVVDFETAPLRASIPDGRYRTVDGLSVAFDLVEPATQASPATVGAVLRNEAAFEQTVRLERFPGVHGAARGEADGAAAYLVPTAEHDLAEEAPDVALDDGRWLLDTLDRDWLPETATLSAGGTLVGRYWLVGESDRSVSTLPAGRYRFDGSNSLGADVDGFEVVIWRTDEPGPDVDSRFASVEVPSLPNADYTAWFHQATPEREVFLRLDAESVSLPAEVDIEVVNHAAESVSGNPLYWRLYKLVDGKWFVVAPWSFPLPAGSLRPGEVHRSTLRLYAGQPLSHDDTRVLGHLGGGRYAYEDGFGGETSHAALLDVDAPDVPIEHDDDLAIERDGDRVVAESPRFEEWHPPELVTVSRADDADQRVLVEQLWREPFRPLRNALGLLDPDDDIVELRTAGRWPPGTLEDDGGPLRVWVRGEAFEVRTEEIDT